MLRRDIVQVKICGVNSPAAFDAAAEAGADWVGFVFFARSPRCVTPAQAATLAGRHRIGPALIGLFVEPDDDEIAAVLDHVPLHALQLYASADRLAAIHARFGLPVWRSVAASAATDLPCTARAEVAFVVEPLPPPGSVRPGGNAVTLDWSLLAGWRSPRPWLLAGGLTPENVGEAIAASLALAVDVSSGVETAPGIKDPGLIAAFVAAARGAFRRQYLAVGRETFPPLSDASSL